MLDIRNTNLTQKIGNFLERKDREFPELKISRRWYDYETTPHKKRQNDTIKN